MTDQELKADICKVNKDFSQISVGIIKAADVAPTLPIWIVMDNNKSGGPDSIKGIFANKLEAKVFVAEYVLDNGLNTDHLHFIERQIEVIDNATRR